MAGDGGNTNLEATEARWTASPLYLAMCDALDACGLTEQAALARITNQDAWADDGDPSWPSPDKATRDRFHALWTANVQARCGLDPLQSPSEQHSHTMLSSFRARRTRRDADIVARATERGQSPAFIARAVGLSLRLVVHVLHANGIPVVTAPPKPYVRAKSETRRKVEQLAADGYSRLAIARALGLTPQAAGYHLSRMGIRQNVTATQEAA